MKNYQLSAIAALMVSATACTHTENTTPATDEGYQLVWSDEFNQEGPVDTTSWNFENGFLFNNEDQWYQEDNATCKDGCLVIECRKEQFPNPMYNPEGTHYGNKREMVEYTSSRITTATKHEFLYGRIEMRAKIPTSYGAWPAFWTLGTGCAQGGVYWPQCGEIDIMEYYHIDSVPHILANVAWGTETRHVAAWRDKRVPFSHFLEKDKNWADKFHVWRMDWDYDYIRLYLDDELINEVAVAETVDKGLYDGYNPHRHPHYILLNLALGGDCGGPIDETALPIHYLIDYVRVYQKKP